MIGCTKQNSKPYIIFAPHVDDEMIGCWTLIRDKLVQTVYYFNDLDESRKEEAITASKAFDFEVNFDKDYPKIDEDMILLVPNIRDAHPHHKIVNYRVRTLYPKNKKQYYSIDMNHKIMLLDDYTDKLDALLKYYPSQSVLLNDGKYFLFESIQDTDVSRYTLIKFRNLEIEIDEFNEIKLMYFRNNIVMFGGNKTDIINFMNTEFASHRYKLKFSDEVIYSGNFND